ncbi:hypothetical protein GCM10027517_11920 [Phycicoccus ginsengisoli]
MTTGVYEATTTTAVNAGRGTTSTATDGVVAVLASSVILATALTGTTATAPWRDLPISATANVRGPWTGAVPLELTLPAARTGQTTDTTTPKALTDQDEIRWAKEHSGLTWDQLGKVMGVSRRAVHLWANGGRMNEANATLLREFTAAVRAAGGDSPERTRAALLRVEAGGVSVLDGFRRRHEDTSGAWQTAFSPEELVGARHDEPMTLS